MFKAVFERSKQNWSSSSTNEKLKQKKKLSFREPEVEALHNNSAWSNRIQSQLSKQPATLSANYEPERIRRRSSLEDLTLEDQTFVIARHVGQAFDKNTNERRRLSSNLCKTNCSDPLPINRNNGFYQADTTANDFRVKGGDALRKNCTNLESTLSQEDAEYFESLSPSPPRMSTMKFPGIEVNESRAMKQPSQSNNEDVPTNVQHQMQFLTYQLEQQRQQTQAALGHIQLLKDQLQAETSARYKAQTQNHQLIMQNKELLDHIQNLFKQIQNLENQLETQRQNSTFPSSQEPQIVGAIAFRSNDGMQQCRSSDGMQQSRSIDGIQQSRSNDGMQQSRRNDGIQQSRSNDGIQQNIPKPFAPNTTMANRRSSLTTLKPFQPRETFLDPNVNRDDNRPCSRGSSPTPVNTIRNTLLTNSATTKTNTNGRKSSLFNSYDGVKENSTSDRRLSVKGSFETIPVSSSLPSLSLKNNSNPKLLMNSESNIGGESSVVNDNPFVIEEKIPGKRAGYSSRNNDHSSDSPPHYTSSQVSSIALSPPKSYSTWSKTSKPHNNNNSFLSLNPDDNPNLSIKENKKYSYPTRTLKMFES